MSNKSDYSMKMFDGSPASDVKKFCFFFDNVVIRGNPDEEKAAQLLSHRDDKPFEFLYERFEENVESNRPPQTTR